MRTMPGLSSLPAEFVDDLATTLCVLLPPADVFPPPEELGELDPLCRLKRLNFFAVICWQTRHTKDTLHQHILVTTITNE